ncbi:putative Nicotinamide/nicotinic acid mononucleotide adenylyltransferase [Blattamonas nauphoetae]|uniref:Nicotinamide/nicotinic acid mononucleotide adenylyltransferase n=1 Tax=Blattamonas nauphoetae TaxID=2049346 RepID=A0ABQ9X788_9EUKA|nr:putative Nicotinamide/nicotinic acid mononucleotide adenylyltransferase [Blattamonas nauphoetae]
MIAIITIWTIEIARYSIEEQKGWNVIGGILSPVSCHYGKPGLLSEEHRLQMCRAATSTSDWIDVDSWESEQSSYKRTAETLESVKARLSKQLQTNNFSLCFLMSMDCLESMTKPGVWDLTLFPRLFQHELIVCGRDGMDQTIVNHENLVKYKDKILFAGLEPRNDISSTFIRQLLSEHKSIDYLTHPMVVSYIKDHRLYTSSDGETQQ